MSVTSPSRVREHVARELERQITEGRALADEVGEDGRPPLTPAQRWRFTSSALLRRTLFDGHPQLDAFERHCYYGLLDRKRFARAVTLFEQAAETISAHALSFRLAMIRLLLESSIAAPQPELQDAGLWHALSILGSTCGLCGPSERPTTAGLCARLVQAEFLSERDASALQSGDKAARNAAVQSLVEELR